MTITNMSTVVIVRNEKNMMVYNQAYHLKSVQIASTVMSNSPKTLEYFLENARRIHEGFYDYSSLIFQGYSKKGTIICPKHGPFQTQLNKHISEKRGCRKCANTTTAERSRLTLTEFIKRSVEVHGYKYDYSQVVYINNATKVRIVCPNHGIFVMIPSSHWDGNGCKYCNGISITCHDDYIKKAITVHGDKYSYEKTLYVNMSTQIIITCKIHGDFTCFPQSHIKGHDCRKCMGPKLQKVFASNNYEFIFRAKTVFGDLYDYSKVEYTNARTKVVITCKTHGDFTQTPDGHLRGRIGCPACACRYSKSAIQWLEYKAVQYKTFIQHAENGGEYYIGKYPVDGFSKELHIVFQFDGDHVHGNIDHPKFPPYELCTINNRTNLENYKRTQNRDEYIQSKGYMVKKVWYTDWIKGVSAVRILQKKWQARKMS
jgi:hypothetical protein